MERAGTSKIRRWGRRSCRIAAVLSILPVFTGCWVQSVYPFYDNADVVTDPALTGTWAGVGELRNCTLKIGFDASTQEYTFEVFNLEPPPSKTNAGIDCEPAKFEGKLAQIGGLRFFDLTLDLEKFWPATLDTIFKVESDKQSVALTPLDAEWMSSALNNRDTRVQGRVQESGGLLPIVAVTLVSPTSDLRDFLLHVDLKAAFSEGDRMRFLRK